MVVGRPRREGHLLLPPGRGGRGGCPYGGGIENGGLWRPEEALEVSDPCYVRGCYCVARRRRRRMVCCRSRWRFLPLLCSASCCRSRWRCLLLLCSSRAIAWGRERDLRLWWRLASLEMRKMKLVAYRRVFKGRERVGFKEREAWLRGREGERWLRGWRRRIRFMCF